MDNTLIDALDAALNDWRDCGWAKGEQMERVIAALDAMRVDATEGGNG